ncbi:unnamed protein product [Calypogeia fissa]
MADHDTGVGNGLASEDMDNVTHCAVVLHVDLDAFYAAVEQVRLGIPKEKPLAVQQWRGLIAINYAARAAGITRHERADQALKKCPELILVHVETIGEDGGINDAPNRKDTKVSLERYRQASASVFSIFRRFSDVYEKASIDEAYLDVTAKVEEMINQGRNWDHELQRLLDNNEQGSPSMVVLDGPLVPFNSYDRRMLAGAIIADQIRACVRNELGYTCSVGIATNKLLAKIASAKNKPDRQTVIPPRAVPGLMKTIPLKKMRLLGGKLGEELTQKWGFSTAGEAQALSITTLVGCFGERQGNYVWNAVRGIQADKVQAKQVPKSMLAAKSFSPIKELSDVRKWLGILSEELSVRMLRDFQQNNRHPKLLQLYYRSGGFKHAKDHSKSWSTPHGVLNLLSSSSISSHQKSEAMRHLKEPTLEDDQQHEEQHAVVLAEEDSSMPAVEEQGSEHIDTALAEDLAEDHSEGLGLVVTEKSKALARVLEEAAYNMFKRLEGTFPCTRLALAASGFQDLGAQGTKSIESFFSNTGAGTSEATLSPKKQKSNSREIAPEKPKGKQKGIMKFLNHVSSMEDRDAQLDTALQSKDSADGPSKLGNVEGAERQSKEGNLDVDSTRGSDGTIEDFSGKRRLNDNEDLAGKTVRTSDQEGTLTGSDGHSQHSKLKPSQQEGNFEGDKPEADLGKVDLKEQMRILADIQRSAAHAPPTSEKQGRRQSASNPVKRPRQSTSVAGQQSIGKFFQAKGKPP